jgi:uncharacterized protein
MIVVSDTSPITALLTIGKTNLIHEIFGEVLIPPSVHRELLRGHMTLPPWLRVVEIRDVSHVRRFLNLLDAGEAEAIVLAEETHADMLLIDERKGRRVATAAGIHVIGLLGVVLLAKKRGLIESAGDLLQRLGREAGMYLANNILRTALESVGE